MGMELITLINIDRHSIDIQGLKKFFEEKDVYARDQRDREI